MATERSFTILGAGPAGLAVGYYLEKSHFSAKIFEAESVAGGACRTLQFGGVRFDMGAHRVHNVFSDVTDEIRCLLMDDLLVVNVPSHICDSGVPIAFPPSPSGLARAIGFWKVVTSMAPLLMRAPHAAGNFRDDAISKYGRPVAERFLINYSEKLWGLPAEQLSVNISGKRLQGLDVKNTLRSFLGLRYGEHLDGSFYYPRFGFGQITDALARNLRHVHTRAKVARVLHAKRRISEVVLQDGRRFDTSTVVSTLPISSLVRMLEPRPPQTILDLAATLRFRSVRLAVFVVNAASVSRSASLYFPNEDVSFTRIYEPKLRSAAMAPVDKTGLVVEFPVFDGDAIHSLSREAFLSLARKELLSTRLVAANSLAGSSEYVIPNAYPVLDVGAAARLAEVQAYLERFSNLHLIGRSACFAYVHFHDLMRQGKVLAERLIHEQGRAGRTNSALPSRSLPTAGADHDKPMAPAQPR